MALIQLNALPVVFYKENYYFINAKFQLSDLTAQKQEKYLEKISRMHLVRVLRRLAGSKLLKYSQSKLEEKIIRKYLGRMVHGDFVLYVPTMPRERHLIFLTKLPQKKIAFVFDAIPFKSPENFVGFSQTRLSIILNYWKSCSVLVCNSQIVNRNLQDLIVQEINEENSITSKIITVKLTNFLSKYSFEENSIPRKTMTNLTGRDKFLLFVSNLEPRKNHKLLLDVIETLGIEGKAINIIFVYGDTWLAQSVIKRIKKMRSQGFSFDLISSISDRELISLYKNCHATLYPSKDEGFGLPILESLSFGKRVLILDREPMNDFADFPGTICFNGSQEDLRDKLLGLWESLPMDASPSVKSLPTVFKDYSEWQNYFIDAIRKVEISI
ncbi:MAG: hypothetical protein RL147_904 [Actinomycetota bacterium]